MFPIIVYYIFHVCIIRYHYSGIYGGMLLIFVAMISFAGVVMYRIYVNLIFKEAIDKPIVNEE